MIFERLNQIDSAEDLDVFIKANYYKIVELTNAKYSILKANYYKIDNFIHFKNNILNKLDFSDSLNKAFLSFLIDLADRLNLESAINILSKFDILEIGSRLEAVFSFLLNISLNQELIDNFDAICTKLKTALEFEEDDERKVIATFLNYYHFVTSNTFPHIQYSQQLKQKIILNQNQYEFLQNDFVQRVLTFEISDSDDYSSRIQNVIDEVLGRVEIFTKYESPNEFIIENNTEFSQELTLLNYSYSSLRENNYQFYHNKGHDFQRPDFRGVKPLQNENDLANYFHSYGNMHYSKVVSGLEQINLTGFHQEFELIDWACGIGIASISFFDFLNQKNIDINVKREYLIEPSNFALKRASLYVKKMRETIFLDTICKDFDSLESADFNCNNDNIKLHFFSNILDVEFYSMEKLISLIKNNFNGLNYFICVSPSINDLKNARFDSFIDSFKSENSFELFFQAHNRTGNIDEYWMCNNKFNGNMCRNHPNSCHCTKAWSRKIAVFKLVL